MATAATAASKLNPDAAWDELYRGNALRVVRSPIWSRPAAERLAKHDPASLRLHTALPTFWSAVNSYAGRSSCKHIATEGNPVLYYANHRPETCHEGRRPGALLSHADTPGTKAGIHHNSTAVPKLRHMLANPSCMKPGLSSGPFSTCSMNPSLPPSTPLPLTTEPCHTAATIECCRCCVELLVNTEHFSNKLVSCSLGYTFMIAIAKSSGGNLYTTSDYARIVSVARHIVNRYSSGPPTREALCARTGTSCILIENTHLPMATLS